MKQYLMLAAIFLLVAGVVYEEKHRAESVKNLIDVPGADYPGFKLHPLPPHRLFVDQVDLWANSGQHIGDDTGAAFTGLGLRNDRSLMGSSKIQPHSVPATEPVLTVEDRELQYAIFTAGGLTLSLNFKPDFATPDAWLPTRVDPGIGASFQF